jgi:phosphotransferase system IIB component
MRTTTTATRIVLSLCCAILLATQAHGQQAKLDTARIEQRTGAKGTFEEKEGVFKVSLPRSDIAATVAGVKMSVPMGLGGWAAFKKVGDQCMVMGDNVMLEDQVNPVMSVALDNGLEVTALHNHFMWDAPRIMFMHIGGMGDEARLAVAVGKVFAKIRETSGGKGETPTLDIDASKSTIDGKKIESILGAKGEAQPGGVFKVTIGRTIRMHGSEVGNMMGINTWASFAGSDEKAVTDGDFVMTEQELQPVLKALRGAGINIVAIHNHMTFEQPRAMFLHFWGVGPTTQLAAGIKAALNTQAKPASSASEMEH